MRGAGESRYFPGLEYPHFRNSRIRITRTIKNMQTNKVVQNQQAKI